MLPNFREVIDLSELKKSLSVCKDEGLSFIVWKNDSNIRLTLDATLKNFFISKAILAVIQVDDTFNLNLNETVYLYQENLKLLFKGNIVKKDKKSFNLQLESKLFLEEKRNITRFVFDKLLFEGYFEVKNEYLEKTKKFKAEIKDVSTIGYSFYISANRGGLFSIGSIITLGKIENISFPNPLKGIIRHITPNKDSFGQTQFLVGVELDKESGLLSDVFAQMNFS
jgi:hypothetical protein